MFGGLINIGGRVVRGPGQCHQAHLARRLFDELEQSVTRDVATHDLEYFLVSNEGFETLVGVAGQQDSDCIG